MFSESKVTYIIVYSMIFAKNLHRNRENICLRQRIPGFVVSLTI